MINAWVLCTDGIYILTDTLILTYTLSRKETATAYYPNGLKLHTEYIDIFFRFCWNSFENVLEEFQQANLTIYEK